MSCKLQCHVLPPLSVAVCSLVMVVVWTAERGKNVMAALEPDSKCSWIECFLAVFVNVFHVECLVSVNTLSCVPVQCRHIWIPAMNCMSEHVPFFLFLFFPCYVMSCVPMMYWQFCSRYHFCNSFECSVPFVKLKVCVVTVSQSL